MSSDNGLPNVRGIYLQITFTELHLNGKCPAAGIYTALFFVTLYAMVFKRQMHKTSLGLFLALVLMYILSTIHVACRWVLVKGAFVNDAESPTSTTLHLLQPPFWLTVLAPVVFTLNTLIADCVLVWRCWIVWNRNWKIVILPLASTLAGAALGFRSTAEQAAYVLNPNLDINAYIDFATPYFALTLATTSLATLLIIFRIFTMTDSATRKSRGYARVIEVVVESALLYSISLIVYLPFLVTDSYNNGYPHAVLAQITGLAPTLIVARATFGLARPDATWGGPQSSMHFGTRSGPGSELPTSTIVLSSPESSAMKLEK
ncbi:hypothetical protein B0H13DRAFT_2358726 [Mycena leptocephala]|nr:hypothetical protein B0H13DRAFT_2358725 [Mycena leptocephala]KAJ7853916.1 hypothetical protein B0H13DRAFT_2358726 [Mycena leptocephala]